MLVIMGSARPNGNTRRAADRLTSVCHQRAEVVDLFNLSIAPFSYDSIDRQDDFSAVVARMACHEAIVFASPVYWYAMSGLLKTFFDRLTDLLMTESSRRVGRSLAGKRVWLLATGTGEILPDGFEVPFARTASYFNMLWQEAFYVRATKGMLLSEPELAQMDGWVARLATL